MVGEFFFFFFEGAKSLVGEWRDLKYKHVGRGTNLISVQKILPHAEGNYNFLWFFRTTKVGEWVLDFLKDFDSIYIVNKCMSSPITSVLPS